MIEHAKKEHLRREWRKWSFRQSGLSKFSEPVSFVRSLTYDKITKNGLTGIEVIFLAAYIFHDVDISGHNYG